MRGWFIARVPIDRQAQHLLIESSGLLRRGARGIVGAELFVTTLRLPQESGNRAPLPWRERGLGLLLRHLPPAFACRVVVRHAGAR